MSLRSALALQVQTGSRTMREIGQRMQMSQWFLDSILRGDDMVSLQTWEQLLEASGPRLTVEDVTFNVLAEHAAVLDYRGDLQGCGCNQEYPEPAHRLHQATQVGAALRERGLVLG